MNPRPPKSFGCRPDLHVLFRIGLNPAPEFCVRDQIAAALAIKAGHHVDLEVREGDGHRVTVWTNSLPPVMKEALGYDFFVVEDGAPIELDPVFGERYAQDYNLKVAKLAWDIVLLLNKLQSWPGGGANVPTWT
jgi:hypothetical protein